MPISSLLLWDLGSSGDPATAFWHLLFCVLCKRALSPPVEDQVKYSLPSIFSLLEGADRQHAAKRQRLSPSQSLNHGVYYTIHVPPTPLRPGSGLGQVHSQEVKYRHRSSVSSTGSAPMYYPRPPTASSFQPPTPVTTPQMPQQQVHHQHPQSIPRSRSLISRVTPLYFPPLL
ncbi:hypothetical protein N7494_005201 [Penicillium frequentans]|uniref:Uncharacterized protein n=1 Tax=Penicillium frequentans TaxID=3151616 RepID=A0AAD6CXR4_9EURO|nr:hypothetical protein N7494_005201 [Penicillium glabrum]